MYLISMMALTAGIGDLIAVQKVHFISEEKTGKAWQWKGAERELLCRPVNLGMERAEELIGQQREKTDRIRQIIAAMTLEQKLAQRMILTSEKDIKKDKLEQEQPGGVLLFGKDFQGRKLRKVKKRVAQMKSVVTIPLLVGVDEEGGAVSRIGGLTNKNVPVFPGARELYEQGGTEAVYQDTLKKSAFLKKMGINVNFAPVSDVVENPASYMYQRSASGDAVKVAEYVKAVTGAMKEQCMGSCLKHFPGYGENGNTHTAYIVDKRILAEYEQTDFIPILAGIEEGVDMVMVSHIVMESVDSAHPASLSTEVHSLLREELGFQGVVLADDLNLEIHVYGGGIGAGTACRK